MQFLLVEFDREKRRADRATRIDSQFYSDLQLSTSMILKCFREFGLNKLSFLLIHLWVDMVSFRQPMLQIATNFQLGISKTTRSSMMSCCLSLSALWNPNSTIYGSWLNFNLFKIIIIKSFNFAFWFWILYARAIGSMWKILGKPFLREIFRFNFRFKSGC